jgi:hypothetical protein
MIHDDGWKKSVAWHRMAFLCSKVAQLEIIKILKVFLKVCVKIILHFGKLINNLRQIIWYIWGTCFKSLQNTACYFILKTISKILWNIILSELSPQFFLNFMETNLYGTVGTISFVGFRFLQKAYLFIISSWEYQKRTKCLKINSLSKNSFGTATPIFEKLCWNALLFNARIKFLFILSIRPAKSLINIWWEFSELSHRAFEYYSSKYYKFLLLLQFGHL